MILRVRRDFFEITMLPNKDVFEEPQCGWQTRKFSHKEKYAARYVIVLGGNGESGHQKSSRNPERMDAGEGKNLDRHVW